MILLYKDEVKRVLPEMFLPAEADDKDLRLMTLPQLHRMIADVLPDPVIDEPMVYECLTELGYKFAYAEWEEEVKEGKRVKKEKRSGFRWFIKIKR